jgi:hypothetical protein
MRILPFLKNSLLSCALAGFLCLWVQRLAGEPFSPLQQPNTLAAIQSEIEDTEHHAGPFSIAGQNYTVVLNEKRLANTGPPALARTLAGVEIIDAAGNVIYKKSFPYTLEQDHFQRNISASAQLVSGKTGAGIVIHYLAQTAASGTSALRAQEFWQLFGMVNGTLAPLGKPAPIGTGAGGGPAMGVVMRASNGAVSMINQPDTIEVRAWTGHFSVFVPLRVDWNHGGLAQGQRCVEMFAGALRDTGCDMRVEAVRKPPADEFAFVRFFSEANENMGIPEHLVVQKDSSVELLGSQAITMWNENAELIQPVLSDVWLHLRIDNRAGWIHGEEDFAAVGLPAGSPAP